MKLRITLICSLPVILSTVSFVAGKRSLKSNTEIKLNSSIFLEKGHFKRKLLLNMNGLPLVSKPNKLNNVFNDKSCQKCIPCMNKAIKARIDEIKLHDEPESVELHNEHIAIVNKVDRIKRSSDNFETEPAKDTKKDKKNKSKKSITVTKYTLQGNIHAVKVKETSLDDMHTTCEVYSVTKAYPCQSPEGGSLIASVKKNKHKKEKGTTTEKSVAKVNYRKRDTSRIIDPDYSNIQMPENVMPSFEDYF